MAIKVGELLTWESPGYTTDSRVQPVKKIWQL